MNASRSLSEAAALPIGAETDESASFHANRAWEVDRAMALDRSGDVRGAYKLVSELRQTDPNQYLLTMEDIRSRLGWLQG